MQHGFESLLPPLAAIFLAVLTRRVVFPLAFGVLIGAMLIARATPDPSWFLWLKLFFLALYDSVFDWDHMQTLAFTLLLGAMVGVMEIGGGLAALIAKFSKRVRSRRDAQVMISLSGLVIFFDDYANTLLIGGTMRSTADRYGISRAKLAYLVDSTAAPVAGLSVISTWAAVEISYMAEGLAAAGIADSSAAFELFLQSIIFRFYPLLAIVFVLMISATGRDFGSMRAVEQETLAQRQGESAKIDESEEAAPRWSWLGAVIPILSCLMAVLGVLIYTGSDTAELSASMGWFRSVVEVLGNGNPYLALIIGGAAGLIAAALTHYLFAGCGGRILAEGTCRGAWQMMPAMIILWLAWALSGMTKPDALDTGGYLANILSSRLDPRFLPSVVFILAGFVAFSTGTSWGAMAILTPLAIELSLTIDASAGPTGTICLATAGSVLAGAILGDHCSPISDTTVLSSRASGCDHMQHVRTQFPYAMVVAVVSLLCGTLPVSIGVSPWLCLLLGTSVLAVLVRLLGRRPACVE